MKNKKLLFLTPIIGIIIFSLLFNLIGLILYPQVKINHPNMYTYLDNNNETILTNNSFGYSSYVELKDVSPVFIKTLITIEDKNFYSHNGFDYLRIIKSAIDNTLSDDIVSGASTITQQVARLIYLNNEKTYSRKFFEALISKRLEDTYHKDFILELYINSTYFAHNIYGLKEASKFYFNKQPNELNYQDSCVLLSIINGPNIYSPFIDYEACLIKIRNIAYSLLKNKIIDVSMYYKIISEPLNLNKNEFKENYPYYIDASKKELIKRNIINENKIPIGLKIFTNIDTSIQQKIENIISNYYIEDEISVVIMKPYSGKILALIGGKDYASSKFNRAIDSNRQIGSTIKPLIYYTALLKGMNPLSKFTSEPTLFTLSDGSTYSPKNANDIYAYREINMIEAIGMSDNIYSLKTTRAITLNSLCKTLNLFDIEVDNPNITLSLGNLELSPVKLCSIYNTFASEGAYYQPTTINKVMSYYDKNIYTSNQNSKQILDKDTVIILNYLLQAPFDKALITYSSPTMKNYQVNTMFSAKTGTTNSSSWTVGFNKDYTVLVYIGNDENNKINDSTLSKKIFQEIVNNLTFTEDNYYSYLSTYHSFKFYNSIYKIYSKTYIK